jgi:ribose transport system permease protein
MALPVEALAPRRAADRARDLAETFGTFAIALVLLLVFWQTSSVFLASGNIRNILVQISVVGVAAIGETIVMLIGGLDLSVGANVLLSSVVIADLAQRQQMNVGLAIAAGIAAATGVGLLNGLLTAVIRIEPILATLGTLLLAAGCAKLILHSSWIQTDISTFNALASDNILFGQPIMVVVMLGLYAVVAVAMLKTPFGREVYALGGNYRAARLSGLPVVRVKIVAYALGGCFAGIAGLLELGQLGIVSQNDATGLEFQAIIAALIGGLSVTAGGVGRVERTLIGALIVGMIANYETINGVPPSYQQAFLGGILLVAVLADRAVRGRQP